MKFSLVPGFPEHADGLFIKTAKMIAPSLGNIPHCVTRIIRCRNKKIVGLAS